jgi:hypothetical protein
MRWVQGNASINSNLKTNLIHRLIWCKLFEVFFFQIVQITVPDKYFQRKVNSLRVNCVECSDWIGTYTDYRAHFNAAHRAYLSTDFMPVRFQEVNAQPILNQKTQCVFHTVGCSSIHHQTHIQT